MSEKKKTGPLSNQEQDFLFSKHTELSVEEMAAALNRNAEPILKFLQNNNLDHGELKLSDLEKTRTRLKKVIQKKYYFNSIKAQLIIEGEYDELEVFTNKWIDMMIQFKEDVLAMEENQMNELILLQINLERIRRQEAKNLKKISELERKLEKEYDLDEAIRDIVAITRWEAELDLARSSCSSYISQIKTVNQDIYALNKSLKGTRDQRLDKIDEGDKTFIGLIHRLQDDTKRRQIARETELIRLASKKKQDELYSFHTYGDGTVDIPILNVESAKKLKEDKDD